jgi:hypothetical protein
MFHPFATRRHAGLVLRILLILALALSVNALSQTDRMTLPLTGKFWSVPCPEKASAANPARPMAGIFRGLL